MHFTRVKCLCQLCSQSPEDCRLVKLKAHPLNTGFFLFLPGSTQTSTFCFHELGSCLILMETCVSVPVFKFYLFLCMGCVRGRMCVLRAQKCARGQSRAAGVFFYFLRQCLSLNGKLSVLVRLSGQWALVMACLHYPAVLRLQACEACLAFYMSDEGLNSGTHTCRSSALLTHRAVSQPSGSDWVHLAQSPQVL